MAKPTICIGENNGADQLRSNWEADQRLCFRYTDSTPQPLYNTIVGVQAHFRVSYPIRVITRVECIVI